MKAVLWVLRCWMGADDGVSEEQGQSGEEDSTMGDNPVFKSQAEVG